MQKTSSRCKCRPDYAEQEEEKVAQTVVLGLRCLSTLTVINSLRYEGNVMRVDSQSVGDTIHPRMIPRVDAHHHSSLLIHYLLTPSDSFCGMRAENGTNDTRGKRVLFLLKRGFQSATPFSQPSSPPSILLFFL